MFALTEIKGVGRRYANIVCKKADVDLNKRWVHVSFFPAGNLQCWVMGRMFGSEGLIGIAVLMLSFGLFGS